MPSGGTWKLSYGATATADLNFDDNAATIQAALRLISGLESVTVDGDYTLGFTATMYGIQTPVILTVSYGTGMDALDAVATIAYGTNVPFSPILLRGDKLIDGSKIWTVKEIIPLPDLGGDDLGYRVRVE